MARRRRLFQEITEESSSKGLGASADMISLLPPSPLGTGGQGSLPSLKLKEIADFADFPTFSDFKLGSEVGSLAVEGPEIPPAS